MNSKNFTFQIFANLRPRRGHQISVFFHIQTSPHLFPEQMSPWEFAPVKSGPTNLPSKLLQIEKIAAEYTVQSTDLD